MQKRPLKITLLMLLLLTFISQAMASSLMSYKMMANDLSYEKTQTVSSSNISTLHSLHDEMTNSISEEKSAHHGKECCSKNSTCLIVACTATTLTSELFIQQILVNLSVKYPTYSELTFSQQPKSLYRPPIFS
jgi:hypothetical protein